MTQRKAPTKETGPDPVEAELDAVDEARQPRDDRDRTTQGRSRTADATGAMERPPMNQWAPPSILETPAGDPEYHYRWVAEYVNGAHTPRNVQMRLRQGYQRVHISELPEDFLVDEDVKGDSCARNGGLILMKIPKAIVAQRDAYYRRRRMENVFAVDELQGVAGHNAVQEDRGSRSLEGGDAGRALQQMSRR